MRRARLLACTLVYAAVVLCICGLRSAVAEGGDGRGYGGAGGHGEPGPPAWESREELPLGLRLRIDALHAAAERSFADLDTVLESFSVDNATIPQAVAKLSDEHDVLCGIEIIPWPLGEVSAADELPHISATMDNATVRQIVDRLVSLDPAFVWVEDDGVVNVIMCSAHENPDYPLNVRIPEFHVEEAPYNMVFGRPYSPGLFSLPEIQQSLVFGSSGRWPREFEPRVSIQAVDATAREIINQVGRQVGMSWSAVASETGKGTEIAWFHMLPELGGVARLKWPGWDEWSHKRLRLRRDALLSTPAGEEEKTAAAAETGTPLDEEGATLPVGRVAPATQQEAMWQKCFPPAKPALRLADTIESFSAADTCVPNILKTLSNDFGLRCGIEVIPWKISADPRKRGSVSAENTRVRKLIDKVVALNSDYKWSRDRDYVNLVLRDADKLPDYPLNIVIPKFEVTEEPYARATMRVLVMVHEETGLATGGGLRHLPDFGPKVTISLENATPREILNEIARQTDMSWHIQSVEPDKAVFLMARKLPVPGKEEPREGRNGATGPEPAATAD